MARGRFGQVFRGMLDNETVAVKVFPSVDVNSWIVEQVRISFYFFLVSSEILQNLFVFFSFRTEITFKENRNLNFPLSLLYCRKFMQ